MEINPPSFSGLTEKTFTTPSRSFSITGNCDINSKSLEYSLDNGPWVELTAGCDSDGHFIYSGEADGTIFLAIRAKKKFGVTAECRAQVRWLLPPTSPSVVSVSASDSTQKLGAWGTQVSLTQNFSGEPLEAGSFHINTQMAGMIYGQ